MRQPGVAAAQGGGQVGVLRGETLDVQFVNHPLRRVDDGSGLGQRGQVGDHAGLECGGGVVSRVGTVGVGRIMAEVHVAAVVAADDFARARVEQQLGRVEAVAFFGRPGAVHPPAVDQPFDAAGFCGQHALPDAITQRGHGQAGDFGLPVRGKQAQLHRLRMRCRQGEVHAVGLQLRAQGRNPCGLQPEGGGFDGVFCPAALRAHGIRRRAAE